MVIGNVYDLPDGGSVWLADDHVECLNGRKANGIIFTNSEGEETRIALSDDAIWALRLLYDARENPEKTGKWVCLNRDDRTE